MYKHMLIGLVTLVLMISCDSVQGQRIAKEQIDYLQSEIADRDLKIDQLSQNLQVQSKQHQELVSKFSELESKLQREIDRTIIQRPLPQSSDEQLDLSGLYKLVSESNSVPFGLRIISLGEGYRIESTEEEKVRDFTGMDRNVAKTYAYVSPMENNQYEFVMVDPNVYYIQHGRGVIIFEIIASEFGLHGTAFFNGDREKTVNLDYSKISDDPFPRPMESDV